MNTLMNHELVHVVNFDRPSGSDHFFRGLFQGKVSETATHPETIVYGYLTAPRTSAPRWYHEGIAVFVETWMAGGLGRAQGSYDEMVFRSMVRDGSRFYDPLGLVSEGTKVDFQLELNSYLYGTRFMSYMAYEHSPEELIQWVRRGSGSKAHYAEQFRRVFGKSLGDAWNEWIEWEHGFQQANLDSLRRYPLTPYEDVSERALGSISRAYYDEDTHEIYAALNYPGVVAHVAAIDVEDGSMRRLQDIKGPMMYSVTSLAYDPDLKKLFYTTDNSAWRDLVELDPQTEDKRTLLEDCRVGDLVFNRADRSIWGVRHDSGFATLVRIPHPYEEWNQIWTLPYGIIPYDLDISSDGSLLSASVAEPNGRNEVRVFQISDLLELESRPEVEISPVDRFDFGSTIPSNFVFSEDGRHLYGTSYLTGVSNVFRYDLREDRWDALSNCETGFFRPIPLDGDQLIVFRYSGEGFVPAKIEGRPLEDVSAITFLGAKLSRRHPVLTEWRVGSPAEVPLDSMISYRGDYRALSSIELESIYPIVEGYKVYTGGGVQLNFSDPISMHKILGSVSYTPSRSLDSEERLHAQVRYQRYDWRVTAQYNPADFYDLFGPTKTSRKGYSLGLGHTRTLVYDQPRELDLHVDLTAWGGLETLPDYQNVAASFRELFTARARLDYRNLRFSLGAVDYEKGTKSSLILNSNMVRSRNYTSLIGTFDIGTPTLFDHASIWLRTAAGFAPPERDEPFSNFFFGGFGNNYVDHLEPKRYREWYALPGYELNEVGGTNFVKATLDWNLPPLRFRKVGTPAFYATWIRTSLFGTGLLSNVDRTDLRQENFSVGGQIDMRMTLLNHLDLTASVGYALGFGPDRDGSDELMISLKIL
jgi:hypothetical protein